MSDWADQAENTYQREADRSEKFHEWMADNEDWLLEEWVKTPKGLDCLDEWFHSTYKDREPVAFEDLKEDEYIAFRQWNRDHAERFEAWVWDRYTY